MSRQYRSGIIVGSINALHNNYVIVYSANINTVVEMLPTQPVTNTENSIVPTSEIYNTELLNIILQEHDYIM